MGPNIPGELIPIVLFVMMGLTISEGQRFTTQLLSATKQQAGVLRGGGQSPPPGDVRV